MELPEQILGSGALLTLIAFSAIAGVLILWAFKRTSNQKALRETRRRLRAHLLALRLFADDPVLVLRSQGRLLLWNFRYLALLLPPFIAVAVPMFLLWDPLEALYARAPFLPGQAAVVTASLRAGMPANLSLAAPDWIALETPPVRVLAENQVSWRIRVRRPGSGALTLRFASESVQMPVEARPGLHYLRERRTLSAGPVEWIEVRYPSARVKLLGIAANWAFWFILISTATALLFRRKLRVTI